MSIWWLKRVELKWNFYHTTQCFDMEGCWFQWFIQAHADINRRKHCHTYTVLCLSFTVFRLLDDSSGFVCTLHFLTSESLPYIPPIRSWNRASVGGQRVSSNRNPRSRAVIWLPVIPVPVPWLCCHHSGFESRCWQMARWTHSAWMWRFPEWNQNRGLGPLLMQCQMPAVERERDERQTFIRADEEADLLQELVQATDFVYSSAPAACC